MAGKKELIMASATRLLEQKNYKELSVLDIVADSNVNRNTFYYHFKDMPALVEALACRCIDRIFSDGDTDLVRKLWLVVDTMYENKTLVMNVFGYADRGVFDAGLDKVCCYVMERALECSDALQKHSEDEKKRIFAMGKACLFGLCSHWLLDGISEEGKAMLGSVIDIVADRI
ncbi:MAG: TetR/AcrR family transcriptional regulator [Clostridia bacterium]|nr:TetR/AcrR family transcriptional regulator [Clostridia bacterium]